MRARGRAQGLALATLWMNSGVRCAVPSRTLSQKSQPRTEPCCLVATLGGPPGTFSKSRCLRLAGEEWDTSGAVVSTLC